MLPSRSIHSMHQPSGPMLGKGAIGIGLKYQHAEALLERASQADGHPSSAPDFLELHAENYMNAGGPVQDQLVELARHYPLSVHGVGLSLGSAEGIDSFHLERLNTLVESLSPALVSEHLAWSRLKGQSYNDLLPVPLIQESLEIMCANVDRVQQRLGRQILVENPSLYIRLDINTFSETDFLNLMVERTGCGLLFDVNNAFISASNMGRDLSAYLNEIPWHAVGEWHLAGHSRDTQASPPLYIDDHGSPVKDAVWQLYQRAIRQRPELPTLIEWDNNVPDLERWMEEVTLAHHHRHRVFSTAGALS